jgi:hypothetical protein
MLRCPPRRGAAPVQVKALISKLGSSDYKEREKAGEKLEDWSKLGAHKTFTAQVFLSLNYSGNLGPTTGNWKVKVEVKPK